MAGRLLSKDIDLKSYLTTPVPKDKPSLTEYKQMVADYLRHREASLRRGRPEQLDDLDRTTDHDLLKKWSWMSAISGGIACYFVIPFFLGIISRFLPPMLSVLLWSFVKVAMALVIAMFGIALYFTLFHSSQQ